MKIQITDQDIKLGQPGIHYACPVALALNRATGQAWSVNKRTLITYKPSIDKISSQPTPEIVRFMMNKFDHKEKIKPFSFILDKQETLL